MAVIKNNTARQFNCRAYLEGKRVTVRIAPGINFIDDEHWKAFVPKSGKKVEPYIADLKSKGFIDFGKHLDDLELDVDPDTKAKSKITHAPNKNKSTTEIDDL
jgi:hypothetical protein